MAGRVTGYGGNRGLERRGEIFGSLLREGGTSEEVSKMEEMDRSEG